jgi:hypothetical protein
MDINRNDSNKESVANEQKKVFLEYLAKNPNLGVYNCLQDLKFYEVRVQEARLWAINEGLLVEKKPKMEGSISSISSIKPSISNSLSSLGSVTRSVNLGDIVHLETIFKDLEQRLFNFIFANACWRTQTEEKINFLEEKISSLEEKVDSRGKAIDQLINEIIVLKQNIESLNRFKNDFEA